jgi:protein-L-isoaspartate(D-aspartate) O-methyltransferase
MAWMRPGAVCLAVLLAGPGPATATHEPAADGAPSLETATSEIERTEMVYRIELRALALRGLLEDGALDDRVVLAMAKVPRHLFVPAPLVPLAYLDRPLPVSADQNIAQPFIIALMTHLARVRPTDVVFETGTGAGYHAAILAELAAAVYSIDLSEVLVEEARGRLERLGYDRVEVAAGDGYFGWPEHAPYDVIMIKEALDHVPPPLLVQLKAGGRMVIPLGPLNDTQVLTVIEKGADGEISRKGVLEVRFSPMQGGDRI